MSNTNNNLAQIDMSVASLTTPIAGIDDAGLAGSARASRIIGSKVFKGDTVIGHIEDILVDLELSSVNALVLSIGGFLGIGQKLVAVPVYQVKVGSEARFTTDLTEGQIARAPDFVRAQEYLPDGTLPERV